MIEKIFIISFIVFAIHYTMLPGEIFGFIEKWWKDMEDRLLERADKMADLAKRESEWVENSLAYNKSTAGQKIDVSGIMSHAKCHNKEADALLKKQARLEKLSQPLFRCPVCMAPYYGTALYWLIPWQRIGLMPHNWGAWLVVIFGALGLNAILVKLFPDKDD